MPKDFIDRRIVEYCEQHTTRAEELFEKLRDETYKKTKCPQMLCGQVEGRLLKMLVSLSGARRALEIGMFTGYSALWIAEGLPSDGRLITCEIDRSCAEIAQRYFKLSRHGSKIKVMLQDALKTIAEIDHEIDFVFIDADKTNYGQYYESVLPHVRQGGILVFDNTLWSGKVLNPSLEPDEVAIAGLNEKLFRDERVEAVMLSVRDGITLVRKL